METVFVQTKTHHSSNNGVVYDDQTYGEDSCHVFWTVGPKKKLRTCGFVFLFIMVFFLLIMVYKTIYYYYYYYFQMIVLDCWFSFVFNCEQIFLVGFDV